MTLHHEPTLDAALRLVLAFLLVLPVGWVREHRSRATGLRAYPLVSVCVCGVLLLAQIGMREPGAQADAFYGVLNGIGFVGSGAIVKSPERAGGMSTAVSLWVAGAVGAGLAYGAPLVSAALALMSAVGLWAPSLLKRSRTTP